jgi:type VI secretion system protein VasD
VRVVLQSTPQLNPGEEGAPRSVLMRVYQLRSRDKFEQGSFRELWKEDEKFLADAVLERKEVTLYPESKVAVDLEVDNKKGAQFLGVVALFRKPEGDAYKKVFSSQISSYIPFRTPTAKLIVDRGSVKLKE